MYNEENKRKYIDYKKSKATLPENYLERLFDETENIEVSYECDVAGLDVPVILEYYKSKSTPSLQSLVIMNGRLSEYVDYSIRAGLIKSSKNSFNDITTDLLKACVDEEKSQQRFLSYKQFIEDINCLNNYVDQFVLYALYEGIKGRGFEQIWKLELKDITQKECHLCNGKIIDLMSSRLYHLANESAKSFFYYTYGKSDASLQMYGEPDQIIKMTNSRQHMIVSDDPVMVDRQNRNIFRKFERAAGAVGWEFVKPRTLLVSGQIEYARRMAEQNNIDIEKLLNDVELFNTLQNRFIKIASKEEFLDAYNYVYA